VVGGELHVPTDLPLGKLSQFSINHETWLASAAQLGVLDKRHSYLCKESDQDSSLLQPTLQSLYLLVVATDKAVYYWTASAISHCVHNRLFSATAKVFGDVVNTSVSTAMNARSSYIRGYKTVNPRT
jgi:hypothetical protein